LSTKREKFLKSIAEKPVTDQSVLEGLEELWDHCAFYSLPDADTRQNSSKASLRCIAPFLAFKRGKTRESRAIAAGTNERP